MKEEENAMERVAELEAENKRLRNALQKIAVFANKEHLKRVPSPSCLPFMTISRHVEKALKGDENE